MRDKITHASTFSGIGAPEIAAEMLGWNNAFHCEINPFGRKVLDYWFPKSKSYVDITKTDFSEWRGKIDVLTGGFPCQPFSYAGKRRGGEDDRYLWPYMLKCIEQVRPTWFVGENVAGITTMVLTGKVSEMGSQADLFGKSNHTVERNEQPYVLNEICKNLESVGYSVQPMLIPAAAVGAPHRRDRVFIIAHREDAPEIPDGIGGGIRELHELADKQGPGNTEPASRNGQTGLSATDSESKQSRPGFNREFGNEEQKQLGGGCGENDIDAHSISDGLERQDEPRRDQEVGLHVRRDAAGLCGENEQIGITTDGGSIRREQTIAKRAVQTETPGEHITHDFTDDARRNEPRRICQDPSLLPHARWQNFPQAQPTIRGGDDGVPFGVYTTSISEPKWRQETLKAYGNAIVVQVMYEIFRSIDILERNN